MELPSILAQHSPIVLAVAHRHLFPFAFTWSVSALVALGAGILILIRPKWLNFIVALYLIVIGISGIVHLRW